jgi:hypothetical protein
MATPRRSPARAAPALTIPLDLVHAGVAHDARTAALIRSAHDMHAALDEQPPSLLLDALTSHIEPPNGLEWAAAARLCPNRSVDDDRPTA